MFPLPLGDSLSRPAPVATLTLGASEVEPCQFQPGPRLGGSQTMGFPGRQCPWPSALC